ncbi:MAG: PqiC family protein [Magnetospirillum sp.]|nr:PqiC family protein [Magnetospirillum sp.]
MVRPGMAVVLVLAVAACSYKAEPQLYVMSAEPEALAAGPGKPEPVVAVMRVRLPEYLDRPELVARSGANALVIDDDNRWGEPLSESVPRVLAENLSRHLPQGRVVVVQEARGERPRYEYLVALDSYEPDGTGNAVMRGRWHLRDTRTGKVVEEGLIDERRGMASTAAPDVVAALNENLNDASRQIAEATAGTVWQ